MASRIDEQTTAENTPASTNKTGSNNALTHGGTSQNLILPGENRADFESLLTGLQTEYQPETQQHHLFVEQLAMAHWFLWRRQRACNTIERAVYESAGHEPGNLNEEHFRRLHLAERYKVTAERALKRAFQNAESIRKERGSERDRRERHARWDAAQDLRERHLALQQQKQKADEARKRDRVDREADENKPPIKWPEGRIGQPVSKEVYDQALADAQKLWDSFK